MVWFRKEDKFTWSDIIFSGMANNPFGEKNVENLQNRLVNKTSVIPRILREVSGLKARFTVCLSSAFMGIHTRKSLHRPVCWRFCDDCSCLLPHFGSVLRGANAALSNWKEKNKTNLPHHGMIHCRPSFLPLGIACPRHLQVGGRIHTGTYPTDREPPLAFCLWLLRENLLRTLSKLRILLLWSWGA